MERWNKKQMRWTDNPAIEAFIQDVLELYKKHNLCLSVGGEEEDFHFKVTNRNFFDIGKLVSAGDDTL